MSRTPRPGDPTTRGAGPSAQPACSAGGAHGVRSEWRTESWGTRTLNPAISRRVAVGHRLAGASRWLCAGRESRRGEVAPARHVAGTDVARGDTRRWSRRGEGWSRPRRGCASSPAPRRLSRRWPPLTTTTRPVLPTREARWRAPSNPASGALNEVELVESSCARALPQPEPRSTVQTGANETALDGTGRRSRAEKSLGCTRPSLRRGGGDTFEPSTAHSRGNGEQSRP
jgi:hypothetical protein